MHEVYLKPSVKEAFKDAFKDVFDIHYCPSWHQEHEDEGAVVSLPILPDGEAERQYRDLAVRYLRMRMKHAHYGYLLNSDIENSRPCSPFTLKDFVASSQRLGKIPTAIDRIRNNVAPIKSLKN